jgi:hypothetical protein
LYECLQAEGYRIVPLFLRKIFPGLLLEKSAKITRQPMPVAAPVVLLLSSRTVANCSQDATLIEGLDALHRRADKGNDSDAFVTRAEAGGLNAVIPLRRNRKQRCDSDKALLSISTTP